MTLRKKKPGEVRCALINTGILLCAIISTKAIQQGNQEKSYSRILGTLIASQEMYFD